MKNVIFDFDGVLVDSFEFHLRKVNEIYDIGLTAKEYKDSHDGNFYASKLKKFTGINFSDYAKQVSVAQSKLPLKDGAEATLHQLAKEHQIHLVTSGYKVRVEPFLKAHKILSLFNTCQYADNDKSKHEKLQRLLSEAGSPVQDFIFVTDTLGDLLEAQTLNIKTIAVTFGYHDRFHLKTGSPSYFADSFKDILSIVSSL